MFLREQVSIIISLTLLCVLQDKDRVWIVTELCSGGDLEHFIKVDLQLQMMGSASYSLFIVCRRPAYLLKHILKSMLELHCSCLQL